MIEKTSSGNSAARWDYSQFFDHNADLPIYQKYYLNGNIPSSITPPREDVPGGYVAYPAAPPPSQADPVVQELLFTLACVSYSGRFGGRAPSRLL